MNCQRIPVRINKKTGKMTIEGVGFEGDQCDILENIENAIGNVENREDKPERYNYNQPDYVPNRVG